MSPFCNSHVKILEQCHVSPPPDAASVHSLSLPLTFFDIPWLLFPTSQPLFFYKSTIIPSKTIPVLKYTLSLTLRHFRPLAGKLEISAKASKPSKPELVYKNLDSVSVTIAESSADFTLFTNNCKKAVTLFHPLVPKLSNLLSVQVTVFPDTGFCIGFSLNQVVADQRTFSMFLKSWASICKNVIQGESVSALKIEPSFDRTVMEDVNGVERILLNGYYSLNSFPSKPISESVSRSRDLVRATFVLSLAHMEIIKKKIIGICEKNSYCLPLRLSPYVLVSAIIWVSIIRAKKCFDNAPMVKKEKLHFGFIAGGIHRLKNLQIPKNYFGNCVAFGESTATEDQILGENGIVFAAKAVASTIEELGDDVLGGAERWIGELEGLFGDENSVVVVGSPKVDWYETDFGWGKPMRVDDICIDRMCISSKVNAVSFTESKDLKGGIEVGVVLPQLQMDVIIDFFNQVLGVSVGKTNGFLSECY